MFKKLLLASLIVLGLVFGSGHDFASLKRTITGMSNDNARSMTSNSNDGWGANSGY
jgi:hypothetical protein